MLKKWKQLFWNHDEKRFRAGYRVLFALMLFFILYKGYLYLLTSAGVKLYYSSQSPLWVFLVAGTVRLFPAIIVLYLGGKFIDRRKIKSFGLRLNKNWMIDLFFGIGLGAILMFLVFIVEMGFGWVSVSEIIHHHNTQSTFLIPLLVFLFYVICQGAFEELLSRGYLLKNLAEGFNLKKMGSRKAVLIAWFLISILFGMGHLGNPNANIISTLNLVLTGMVFGAGMVLTGELAIPIGLHVSWNFFQGNVFGFPISGLTYPAEIVSIFKIDQNGPDIWTGGKFGPEAGLLGLFANLLGLLLIILWVYMKHKKKLMAINVSLADAPNQS